MKLGLVTRDQDTGVLRGVTPVKYRMVFELDPPIKGRKKQDTEDSLYHRLEFFSSDEDLFYLMQGMLSRLAGDQGPGFSSAQAIILTEDSQVLWTDRNADEAE